MAAFQSKTKIGVRGLKSPGGTREVKASKVRTAETRRKCNREKRYIDWSLRMEEGNTIFTSVKQRAEVRSMCSGWVSGHILQLSDDGAEEVGAVGTSH